jgi:hypothetical protein
MFARIVAPSGDQIRHRRSAPVEEILPAFRARLDETELPSPKTDEISSRTGIPPERKLCRKFL